MSAGVYLLILTELHGQLADEHVHAQHARHQAASRAPQAIQKAAQAAQDDDRIPAETRGELRGLALAASQPTSVTGMQQITRRAMIILSQALDTVRP